MICPRCKSGTLIVINVYVGPNYKTANRRCQNPKCRHQAVTVTQVIEGPGTAYSIAKKLRGEKDGKRKPIR